MAQSVKRPTHDFNSHHDLRVLGSSPTSGSVLSREFAWDSLTLLLLLFLLSLLNICIFPVLTVEEKKLQEKYWVLEDREMGLYTGDLGVEAVVR